MSRRDREAKLKAFYGDRYPAVLVSELGGRKRDRRAMLSKELGSYEQGSLAGDIASVLSRSRGVSRPAAKVPPGMDERLSLLYRQVMNSPATMAGLGLALARGAEVGPGPGGSIQATYKDPSGLTDPQTLGDVMLVPERYQKSPRILTHELGHVRQGRFFGPLLPAASALGVLGGYEKSPFETQALEMGQTEAQNLNPLASRALLAR